ncbi:MAG: hypothetical protein FWE44_00505, partial [Defluviitaleaceae bacterium]|nr:hypothetical protein [Defluviitaleaceae bacterium]
MFTNQMRMTGFSGIDVADMVSQMMRAESARLNRLTGQRQIFAWQQEQMRSISTNLTNFRRDWTDITLMNSDRGIANPNNFVSASATLSGGSGNGINVTPVSGARNGVHTLEVNRIATADVFRSTSNVNTGAVSQGLDFDRLLNDDGEFRNFSFSVNVNGTARTISFTAAEMESFVGAGGDPVADFDLDAFADAIDAQLATAFPVGGGQRVSASVNGDGRLVIEAAQGNNVTLGGNITMLGIQAGNVGLNTQMSLGQFLGLGAGETTTITLGQANRANDAYRSFGADDTIQDVMNWINGSNIDARISFSQSTGLFTMEGTRTGEGNAITFSSSGDADFFARAGFVDIPAVVDGDGVVTSPAISTQITEAGNAEFLLNGTLMSRETNNFTESDLGLNIQLTSAAETAGEVTITVAADTS